MRELRQTTVLGCYGWDPWTYWTLPPSPERAQLDMNCQEDGTQGKDSGTDLHQGVIFESPPTLCTRTRTRTRSGLRNVRDCAGAGQEPRRDKHYQADHDAPGAKDPATRLKPATPREFLAGMDVVRNLQVAVVLNMKQPTITDFVYHPNRLTIFSPLINQTLVALHASSAKSDGVSALDGRPHRYTTALQHSYCPSGPHRGRH